MAANRTTSVSIILNATEVKPPNINVGRPKTIHILNILVPIILPTARSCSPFFEAFTVIISSGSDVPITIIVIEIIFWLIRNSSARYTALSTAMSLASAINNKVITIYKIERLSVYLA